MTVCAAKMFKHTMGHNKNISMLNKENWESITFIRNNLILVVFDFVERYFSGKDIENSCQAKNLDVLAPINTKPTSKNKSASLKKPKYLKCLNA